MRRSFENAVLKLPRLAGAASVRDGLLVVLMLAATLMVYWPIVHCFFSNDDFVHLYRGVQQPWDDLITQQWGGHVIAVFCLLTAAMVKIFGPSAEAFHIWVLASHLLAVGLLFLLVRRLTDNTRAAAIVGVLWGTTPAHTETLAWFSVYGQVIATIAMLLAVLVVMPPDGARTYKGAPLIMAILLLIGALAFGVGIAVALVFPPVLWLLLSPGPVRRWALVAASVVALIVLAMYHETLGHGGLPSMGRAFFPLGRRFTDAVAANTLQLLIYGITRLHVGAFAGGAKPSFAMLATTSICWALCVGVGLVRMSGQNRRRMVAFALMLLAIYVSVAFGRSIVLAIFGQSEMGSIKRYHYAATLPLAVLSGLTLDALIARSRALIPNALFAIVLTSAIVGSGTTARDIAYHPNVRAETARVLAAIEEAARAVPRGATVRIPDRRFGPARTPFIGWAAIFAIWSTSNYVDGRRVVFEETDPAKVAAAAQGRRSGGLIVAPETGADVENPSSQERYF
jgi:hypothetical protein